MTPMTAINARITDRDTAIDDAGRDSFPASDPPTWWAGTDALRTPVHEDAEGED